MADAAGKRTYRIIHRRSAEIVPISESPASAVSMARICANTNQGQRMVIATVRLPLIGPL
ncbi:MAG: hypothetical protein ABSA02_01185 [Trebonia sp.]